MFSEDYSFRDQAASDLRSPAIPGSGQEGCGETESLGTPKAPAR